MILFIGTQHYGKNEKETNAKNQLLAKFSEADGFQLVDIPETIKTEVPSIRFHFMENLFLNEISHVVKKEKIPVINQDELLKLVVGFDKYQNVYLTKLANSYGFTILCVETTMEIEDDFENNKIFFKCDSDFFVDAINKVQAIYGKFQRDQLYSANKWLNYYGFYIGPATSDKKIDKVFRLQDLGSGQKIYFREFLDLILKNREYNFLQNEFVLVRKHHPFEVIQKALKKK